MAPRKSIIPADAADDGRLSRNDYRLLIALGRHVDARSGFCVVRHETLADELGLTRRSIIRLAARLVEFGYIAAEHRYAGDGSQLASSYRLLSPARQGALFGENVTGGCDSSVTGGCDSAGVTGGVTHGVTPVTTLSERKYSLSQRGGGRTRLKKTDRPTIADGQRELLPVTVVAEAGRANFSATPRGGDGPPSRQSEMAAGVVAAPAQRRVQPVPEGRRIADDWQPNDVDVAFAARHGLAGDDLAHEIAKFVNHWRQRAGPDALKADWSAAWRSWVLRFV